MTDTMTVHASAIVVNACGVLITGPSGSGKSSLALALCARGAQLIGDDQITMENQSDGILLRPHPNARGRIEARGVGILQMAASETPLWGVVDLAQEPPRLPEPGYEIVFGKKIRKFSAKGLPHFADVLYLLLTEQAQICELE